jgi:hypothetical protein
MTNIQVLGINIQRGFQPSRSFSIAAFGDIAMDELELTMRGCALAYKHGEFIALPPKIPGQKSTDLNALQWAIHGDFAISVRDKLLAAYESFGGEVPSGAKNHGNAARRIAKKRIWVGAPEDHVPDVDPDEFVEGILRYVGSSQ